MMLQGVSYPELPEDTRDCIRYEKAFINALHDTLQRSQSTLGYTIIKAYKGVHQAKSMRICIRTEPPMQLGLKPDYLAVTASGNRVYAVVVEAACTSINHALDHLAPRLLLYKAHAEKCIGPRTVAVYAPLTPPQPGEPWAAVLAATDPLSATRCLEQRLREVAQLARAQEPPSPGNPKPPCMHCSYRNQCPYAGEQQ